MSMHQHTCIKPTCDKSYESEEAEAYYCPSCEEANKAIAKKIDAQIASRPKRKTTSAWKEYENAQKISARGMQGVQIKI